VGSSFDVEQLLIVATAARITMIAVMGMRKAHGQKSLDGGHSVARGISETLYAGFLKPKQNRPKSKNTQVYFGSLKCQKGIPANMSTAGNVRGTSWNLTALSL
jgi:hypothetical protein